MSRRVLRSATVRNDKLGGISEATFWRLRQKADFPAPIMLGGGGKTPMWFEDEIDAYLESQPRGR